MQNNFRSAKNVPAAANNKKQIRLRKKKGKRLETRIFPSNSCVVRIVKARFPKVTKSKNGEGLKPIQVEKMLRELQDKNLDGKKKNFNWVKEIFG